MNQEQEKTIDRFGLVQAYQNASSKADFLYMLMNLEAVQAQSGMMAYIRQMLQTIREYVRHRALALAKGLVLSIFPGKGNKPAAEYERFEETPEFSEQMDGLWRALGIDYEAYSDREVIRQHDELSDALKTQGYEKEAVRCMEYDTETGIFAVPELLSGDERKESPARWRSFAVLSKTEYERLAAYFGEREHEEQPLKVLDVGLLSGDIIVDAEPDIVREYLSERETTAIEEDCLENEEKEEEEAPDDKEQEKQEIDAFSDWLDRINAAREKCAAQGLSRTAAAAALFLHEHGLEKRDGRWVQIITYKTGTVQEKPLTVELVKGIDREQEARLLNAAYRREALEKADLESRQEKEQQRDVDIPTRNKRTEIDR